MRTESELLLESILNDRGHTQFEFERAFEGTPRRPDYTLTHDGGLVLFEVKEFEAAPEDFRTGFGSFDPYGPIREKLDAAREKFKGLKKYPCCVVLYNSQKPLVDLRWEFVYGAMLGNLTFSLPLHMDGTDPTPEMEVTTQFGEKGKMHRERNGVPFEPQNTTISAVIVVQHLDVGARRFRGYIRELQASRGEAVSLEEHLHLMEAESGTPRDVSLRHLRVVVHENPYARIPMPRDLFVGPFDERYGPVDRGIGRIFAGVELLKLPATD
jgi:hypothetical protein